MRERERRELSDASLMVLGIAISLSFFGGWAVIGLAISIVGDALASLFGKLLGGPRLPNSKTIVGFLAFPFWAFLVAISSQLDLLSILLVGVVVGLVEAFGVPWENLSLGVVSSFLVWLLLG